MVMQLIEGQPWNLLIEEIHREHPINLPDDVFDIEFERFIKTCEAVEYSHSKGICIMISNLKISWLVHMEICS